MTDRPGQLQEHRNRLRAGAAGTFIMYLLARRSRGPASEASQRLRPLQFLQNYWAAVLLIGSATLLGFTGYMKTLARPPFEFTGGRLWLEAVLSTGQMILSPFSGPPGGLITVKELPWELTGARILMPVAMVSSLLLVLARAFRRTLRSYAARFAQNHVVVFASGEQGAHMIAQLARSNRQGLIVVEMTGTEAAAEPHHQLGLPVVTGGRPIADAVFRRSALHRARALVALCEDDLLNAEILLKAKLVCTANRGSSRSPLLARAAVADPDVRQACSLILAERSANFEYGLISIPRNMVRALLAAHPLDLDPGVLAGGRVHVLIIGFGETGRALALEVARGAHFADRRLPLMTVVDQEAAAHVQAFVGRYPGLPHAAELRTIDLNLRQDALEGVEKIFAAEQPTRAVVCFGNEGLGLATAARTQRLARRSSTANLPIFVRLSQTPTLAGAIASPHGEAGVPHLIPFGDSTTIYSREMLLEERLDVLARAVHQTYLEMMAGSLAPAGPSREPWETLSETYRDASRHQADHTFAKLRAANCEAVPGLASVPFHFTDEEVERLAQMEHARWCAERLVSGWRYAPARNDEALEHPTLVPWSDLPESERQKDRNMVNGLPRMLARAGLHIRRRAFAAPSSPGICKDAQRERHNLSAI